MYTIIHLVVALTISCLYSFFTKQTIDPSLIFYAILGATLIDLDHVFVIFTQKTQFAKEIRKSIRCRDFKGIITKLRSNERKEIGKMYLHNFWFFGIVIIFSFLSLHWSNVYLWVFLFCGVIPHMLMDMIDDLMTVHSINNWLWMNRKYSADIIGREEDIADQLTETLSVLDECSEDFRKLLTRYAYYIAASSTSLLKTIQSTLVIRWHIARRVESYVRLYQTVLPWLRLQLNTLNHATEKEERKKELRKLHQRGDRILKQYSELVKDLEDLSKTLVGRALSYLSSFIIFLIIIAIPAIFKMVPQETTFFYFERDTTIAILMFVCIVFLIFWDANLYEYVSVTTEPINKRRTLMDLEISLYLKIVELFQVKTIKASKSRRYYELCFFLSAFGLLVVLGTYVNYFLIALQSPLLSVLAITITVEILVIPIIFIRYTRNLIGTLN